MEKDDDLGCLPLTESDEEAQPSLSDAIPEATRTPETCFDCNQLKGALVFVYLPGSSAGDLRQIISNLKDCGAEVSQFFHKKISYLITSNNCIEMEKRKKVISRKLLTDPSSRGAMFLGKATKEQSNDGIFEKAKRFGISIVSFDEISVFLSKSKDM